MSHGELGEPLATFTRLGFERTLARLMSLGLAALGAWVLTLPRVPQFSVFPFALAVALHVYLWRESDLNELIVCELGLVIESRGTRVLWREVTEVTSRIEQTNVHTGFVVVPVPRLREVVLHTTAGEKVVIPTGWKDIDRACDLIVSLATRELVELPDTRVFPMGTYRRFTRPAA